MTVLYEQFQAIVKLQTRVFRFQLLIIFFQYWSFHLDQSLRVIDNWTTPYFLSKCNLLELEVWIYKQLWLRFASGFCFYRWVRCMLLCEYVHGKSFRHEAKQNLWQLSFYTFTKSYHHFSYLFLLLLLNFNWIEIQFWSMYLSSVYRIC